MVNKWFKDVFLPSLIEKMENNEKYPNSTILTLGQVDVCCRHMYHREARTCYGRSAYWEITIDGYVITVQKRGKYYFMNCQKVMKDEAKEKARSILEEIEGKEDVLDVLYKNKEVNAEEIKRIEAEVNKMWQDYHECYKIK